MGGRGRRRGPLWLEGGGRVRAIGHLSSMLDFNGRSTADGVFAVYLAVEDSLQAGGVERAAPPVLGKHIKPVHPARRTGVPQGWPPQQQLPRAAEADVPGHPPADCTTAEM